MQVTNSAAATASSEAGATRKYRGVIDCVLQTVRRDGVVRGLFRGQSSLLLREIPGNFCWYGGKPSTATRPRPVRRARSPIPRARRATCRAVYEGVCAARVPEGGTRRDLGTATHLLGGAAAGVAYWTAFYPADTVGSQIRARPDYAARSFADVFRRVHRREGWRGLYRGWGITALRAAPAHALIFAMYEQTLGVFRRLDDKTVE